MEIKTFSYDKKNRVDEIVEVVLDKINRKSTTRYRFYKIDDNTLKHVETKVTPNYGYPFYKNSEFPPERKRLEILKRTETENLLNSKGEKVADLNTSLKP